MRGDFSTWRDERKENFNGVLHQQGRVLLDSDWNAQTRITNDWQDIAAGDIIGALVAAVPADAPDSYKVTKAEIKNGTQVELTVGVGRVWADGLLSRLFGPDAATTEVKRIATYLQPPIQNPAATIPKPPSAPPLRDAVILELWREEINGFQLFEQLIEPALGGVDTTERVHTGAAFRLMRLKDGDTCESIVKDLQDKFDKKGKLTVTLTTPPSLGGDCEVKAAGGYTGFEHNLYRVEIAQVKSGGAPMFKWSQFNGGLVGRGVFSAANKSVALTGNIQAILNSGLSSFYLEAFEYDPAPEGDYGYWRMTYGATATLDSSNGALLLPTPGSAKEIFGTLKDGTFFFRLWNDVRKIEDFQTKQLLQDGIELDFDWPSTPGLYTPGDYWTFPVRAGEIKNSSPLINAQPPEGIEYHRVPLGILTWNALSITFDKGDIEDCRHIFRPLTRLSTCCTFRVGDGMHSFGDFDSIQKAIDHLPAGGGEICLLPGVYEEHIKILNKSNIHIKGCGKRSVIKFDSGAPVIQIKESNNIRIESLAVMANEEGIGILLEGPAPKSGDDDDEKELYLHDITLENLLVRAARRSAIEAHVGQHLNILGCTIAINDLRTEWAAIYLAGDDCVVENNQIFIVNNDNYFKEVDVPEPVLDPGFFKAASAAQGGLHLSGGCERVRVINNLIVGGIGDGITLGSVDEKDGDTIIIYYDPWWPAGDDKADCDPNPGYVDGGVIVQQGQKKVAGAALHDILIERNRIFNMGRNGIGVDAFFDLEEADEIISVENLTIIGNRIQHCLNRNPVEIPTNMTDAMGYGGIALADVDNLVVRDNFIEDNGEDYLQPVCGIFILHGDGIEISRNRIRNNGARTNVPPVNVKNGRRGGINVVFGVAPRVDLLPPPPGATASMSAPFSNGIPAIKIHENIVSVPLGQALSLVALGPVTVVGNQFTSLGMVMRQDSPTFIAATVMIFNLGLSNELWLQLLGFLVVHKGQINNPKQPGSFGDADEQAGLDDERLGQYLANGNVLFTNNQCQLNLMEKGWSIPLSSITILTLDDIAFHNNQCDCDLMDDFVFWQAMLIGMSVRVSDNRFKESLINALLSAVTYGWINITTDNQATHCLLILGQLYLNKQNIILIDSFLNPSGPVETIKNHWCKRLQENY